MIKLKRYSSFSNRLCGTKAGLAALSVGILWVALSLTGCTGVSSSTIARSPDGPAMELANALYLRGESLRTMAARGGVSYTFENKRHYFKVEVVVDKPGRMLFTAFDPAGRPAFRLASDGKLLTGIMYTTDQFVTGPATAANFARFIPLGLSPDQLAALMSGAQVRPASAGAAEGKSYTELAIIPAGAADADNNVWRLRFKGALSQDAGRVAVESANFGPRREPRLSMKYMSIKDVAREDQGGRLEPFPHSVEVDWNDGEKRHLRLTYEEVRLGLALEQKDNMFILSQPKGFELVQLY